MSWKDKQGQADETGFVPPKEKKGDYRLILGAVVGLFTVFGLPLLLLHYNRCGEKNIIRVNNLAQPMIHQPREYSLIVEGTAAVTVYGDPVVTHDVSPEEKPWAQFTTDPDGRASCSRALPGTFEIHLRPKQEVRGASWERCYHSSHGGTHCQSGTTMIIE